MKAFPIDFIRQIIEQTLLEEHIKEPTRYFGGKNQVNLFSFYEQLQKEDEVNRYVETYNDLVEQQNRTGLIMNGTIIAPENPTITNLYLDTIIPMTFTCSFRVKLADRDSAIQTINNLIEVLKGRKQDVALTGTGKIFKVGCIANDGLESPKLKNGDFIGRKGRAITLQNFVTGRINHYTSLGILNQDTYPQWYYFNDNNLGLSVAYKEDEEASWRVIDDYGEDEDVIIPPYERFEQYKVSMSFDSLRCDEPRTLNANEYCVISFGGSATLVNNGVMLGNDLVKLGIVRNKILANPNVIINEDSVLFTNATWLEPLEMPSGSNANTITNILNSNRFNTDTHTTNTTNALQYSFVLDRSIPFLDELFKYGRFGKLGVNGSDYSSAITPNMIFTVFEVYSSWGQVEVFNMDTKLVEDISIENTESDTMSISITLQKQGANA